MAIIFLFCWGLIAPQEYFHTVFNSAPNNQERFPLEPSYTWSHLLCGNDQHRREWLIIALSCLADILETSASFASKNHQLWVQFQLDKGLWIVLIVHWKLIDDLQCRQHLTELSRNFSCHRFTQVIFPPLIFCVLEPQYSSFLVWGEPFNWIKDSEPFLQQSLQSTFTSRLRMMFIIMLLLYC